MKNPETFWARVERTDDCWLWQGRVDRFGYGRVGRNVLAHRVAYSLTKGDIPAGLLVCHHCDNPPCVNPDHLYVGTRADNSRDMRVRKRHPWGRRTHCAHGHPFNEENTYQRPGGGRGCRTCNRDAQRRMTLRRRAA